MAFPTTQLTLLVELALNADLTAAPGTWSWTDVTAYVYTRDPVRITRGRPDETSIAQPQKLTLTVNNRDGRWSTRNPSGAWYGQLRKGTPIRVSAEGHVRYAGFISALPPRWDVSGRDRYAPLEAQGLLYRLAQGASPARSAIKRTTLALNGTTPSAYWPLEDGGGTAVGAAGSAGVLTPSGLVGFGATAFGPAGSAASLDLSGGGMLTGRTGLPVAAVASWEVTAVMGWNTAFPSGSPTSNQYMTAQFLTGTNDTGANPAFGFAVVNGGIAGDMTRWQVAGANLDAPSVGSSWHFRFDTTESLALGSTYHVRMVLAQSGGNVSFNLYVNGTLRVTNAFVGTLYQPVAVNINGPASDTAIYTVTPTNPDSLSHLTIYVPARGSDAIYAAKDGYAGEQAGARFTRLCAEEGVPATLLDAA